MKGSKVRVEPQTIHTFVFEKLFIRHLQSDSNT